MSSVAPPVPAAFLFRPGFDLVRLEKDEPGVPFTLPESARLPALGTLDGVAAFADVRCGWSQAGLAVSVSAEVTPRPEASHRDPAAGDGLHLWVDTRPGGTSHRAGKFCTRFALLPRAGGRTRAAGVFRVPITRGGPGTLESLTVPLDAEVTADGYTLSAFLPAAELPGFEAADTLGLHCVVRHRGREPQSLSVGGDFPTDHDPSLWATARLGR